MRVVKKGKVDLYKTKCHECGAEYDEITTEDADKMFFGKRDDAKSTQLYTCPNCSNLYLRLESYTSNPNEPEELDSDKVLRLDTKVRALNFRLDRIKEVLSQEVSGMKNDSVSGETNLYVSSLIGRIAEYIH